MGAEASIEMGTVTDLLPWVVLMFALNGAQLWPVKVVCYQARA